jgi:hypothetical protein
MLKFRSVRQLPALPPRSHWLDDSAHGRIGGETPTDTPRAGDVVFEIGVILALHLGLALVVTLLLWDCTSC